MPRTIERLWHRLRALLLRRRVDTALSAEIALHLDEATREYIARGLSPEDARLAARRDFGPVALVEEQCRDTRRVAIAQSLIAGPALRPARARSPSRWSCSPPPRRLAPAPAPRRSSSTSPRSCCSPGPRRATSTRWSTSGSTATVTSPTPTGGPSTRAASSTGWPAITSKDRSTSARAIAPTRWCRCSSRPTSSTSSACRWPSAAASPRSKRPPSAIRAWSSSATASGAAASARIAARSAAR